MTVVLAGHVTFTGLADLYSQLGSWHGQLCGDITYLALTWKTLEIHKWDLGTSLANSFSGIHKSKIIYAVCAASVFPL